MIEISTAIQTTLQAIMQVKDISEKWQDAQVRALLISSIDQMQDVKEGALTLREENLRLRTDLAALTEKQRLKESLVFKFDSYWLPKDGELLQGPFCTKCFDDEGKMMRLQTNFSGRNSHACPKCKNGTWIHQDTLKELTGDN
jgi:hypothetical protein